MNTHFDTLTIESHTEHVLLVTLNRPSASNAFNTKMAQDLLSVFEQLTNNPTQFRVVVLTGAGDKAFCAGGDLKERNGMSDEQWQAQHSIFEKMIRSIINCPLPVIGAVNGVAFGGGCEITAALDFVFVADTARFAQTEVSLGIIPGIGASDAVNWGLANASYPQDTLMKNTLAIATKIANNAPIAVRQAKHAIHHGLQMSLSDGMALELDAYNKTIPTEDRFEGVLAFNEKRSPVFQGK